MTKQARQNYKLWVLGVLFYERMGFQIRYISICF